MMMATMAAAVSDNNAMGAVGQYSKSPLLIRKGLQVKRQPLPAYSH